MLSSKSKSLLLVQIMLFLQMTDCFTVQKLTNSRFIQQYESQRRTTPLYVASSSMPSSLPESSSSLDEKDTIHSSTLKQLYPKLVAWKEEYGNPNIPLGTEGGRQCQLLRRLHIQQKLQSSEIELLENMGFQFQLSLEDLYWDADFNDMFRRLETYQRLHPTTPIPKKYRPDPELGAWVTGVRRLGKDRVLPEHALRLAYINFSWKSENPCGSKFMVRYREILENVAQHGQAYLQTPETQEWVKIQRRNRNRQKMSDTRYHYMINLLGEKWMEA